MIRELRCKACGRRFIFVSTAAAPCRACGAALEEMELERGIYELADEGVESASSSAGVSREDKMVPEDLGYGESHGYGPSHGGPTGPGDAPANTA